MQGLQYFFSVERMGFDEDRFQEEMCDEEKQLVTLQSILLTNGLLLAQVFAVIVSERHNGICILHVFDRSTRK